MNQDHFTHCLSVMNDMILNAATLRNLCDATLRASMQESRYGSPQPELEVRFPKGTHYRRASAVLHALAAIIELATPARESWVVVVDHGDELGHVYLELAVGSADEARRGLDILKRAVVGAGPRRAKRAAG
jgi:hypothetical protein